MECTCGVCEKEEWYTENMYQLSPVEQGYDQNKYPFLCTDDLFDHLQGASVFSKIDLRLATTS